MDDAISPALTALQINPDYAEADALPRAAPFCKKEEQT